MEDTFILVDSDGNLFGVASNPIIVAVASEEE